MEFPSIFSFFSHVPYLLFRLHPRKSNMNLLLIGSIIPNFSISLLDMTFLYSLCQKLRAWWFLFSFLQDVCSCFSISSLLWQIHLYGGCPIEKHSDNFHKSFTLYTSKFSVVWSLTSYYIIHCDNKNIILLFKQLWKPIFIIFL